MNDIHPSAVEGTRITKKNIRPLPRTAAFEGRCPREQTGWRLDYKGYDRLTNSSPTHFPTTQATCATPQMPGLHPTSEHQDAPGMGAEDPADTGTDTVLALREPAASGMG